MTRPAKGPLSRVVNVERLPKDREDFTVMASPEECAALASDFGLVALRDLNGRFRLTGTPALLTVTGTVEAYVTQICTVSLDPFEAHLSEPVDVDFSDAAFAHGQGKAAESETASADSPDEIVNGRIDLGALTAEFLALGLDPFPRKPGAVFEPTSVGDEERPFDVLRKLRDERT